MTESEATETPSATFGNACTSALDLEAPVNKMEISQEYDHALDGTGSCAGSKPLPNFFPKVFPCQGHPMDAEWTQRRGGI